MAFKEFALDERTSVTIYKRKASRSLRLTVAPDGKIKVSIPTWIPYKAGLEFAKSRQEWISTQRTIPALLRTGQAIGKAHRLLFLQKSSAAKISSRITGGEIIISYPPGAIPAAANVQQVAKTASIKALRLQAEKLLPQRLQTLAGQHGFEFNSVSVKQLKGRWGSCDNNKNIVLNLYLMQLPWDLIDYVLIHELVHTEVMRHGPDFWREMERVLPGAKARRKAMRQHQPSL